MHASLAAPILLACSLVAPVAAQSLRVAQPGLNSVSDLAYPSLSASTWSATQSTPISARQGPDRMTYVTEAGIPGVRRYFPNGTLDPSFALPANHGLTQPFDIAFDAAANLLWVSDFGGQVVSFLLANVNGDIVKKTTLTNGSWQPTGLLMQSDGSLLVADYLGNTVLRFLPQSTLPTTFVAPGSGGLLGPTQMVRYGARIYVVSTLGSQLLSFDVAGGSPATIAPIGLADTPTFPLGVAVSPDGNIHVSDFVGNVVRSYDITPLTYLGATALTSPAFLSWVAPFDAPFPLKRGDVVTTFCPNDYEAASLLPTSPCVKVFATRYGGPTGANWPAASFWNQNSGSNKWTLDNLGPVFGITLDDAKAPSIYVAASTTYAGNIPMGPAGPGGVYRLDGCTGAITKWMVTGSGAIGTNTLPNLGIGLGDIYYDRRWKQFFVSNFEDGKIYRVKSDGKKGIVQQVFDPFAADNGLTGAAPRGERVWAVCTTEAAAITSGGTRLLFSAWLCDSGNPPPSAWPAAWPPQGLGDPINNAIFSVDLDPLTGAISGNPVSLWKVMPPLAASTFSNPVSDMAVRGGLVYLAERTMYRDVGEFSTGSLGVQDNAHASRVLMRLDLAGTGFDYRYRVGDWGVPPQGWNSSGGVGLGVQRDLWATGDELLSATAVHLHGLQHFNPAGNANATPYSLPTKLIDIDGIPHSPHHEQPGDVEGVMYDASGCDSGSGT